MTEAGKYILVRSRY